MSLGGSATLGVERQQLATASAKLGIRPNYVHVKGHQDKETPYHQLSLLARLNVDADKLAGQFLSSGPNVHRLAPLLTQTKAHLDIAGVTITSNHRYAVRQASTGPVL